MKIQVEKWIINKANEEYSYHITNLEKCCDEIINSPNITINIDYNEHYSVKLIQDEYDYDEDGHWDNTYYEEIQYCPFCGGKIEIEVMKKIDMENKYEELSKVQQDLIYKRNHTDSKKKENELQTKINLISKDLNSMLRSDDFSEYKMQNK